MLNYLVQPKAKRLLLTLLWKEGMEGSVSELARLAGLNYQSAHKELNEMEKAGLANCKRYGNATYFSAAKDNQNAGVLTALFKRTKNVDWLEQTSTEHFQNVRAWLMRLGAPLAAAEPTVPSPDLEKVLALGVTLARLDSSVARTLPVTLWKNRHQLNLDKLLVEARKENQGNAMGFFLELTGTLAKDPAFVDMAQHFRDKRCRKNTDFFVNRKFSKTANELAATRTPMVARKWHLVMNMSLDSFESTFKKFL